MIAMSKREAALAANYGLKVSEDGTGHYIVRDPEMPKGTKYVGGNLEALIYRALDKRKQLKGQNILSHDFRPLPTPKAAFIPPRIPEPKPEPEPEPEPDLTPHSLLLEHPEPMLPEPVVPQEQPAKQGKLYAIKKVLMDNPSFSASQIMSALKARGINIPMTTITVTRSDFLNSIKVIKEYNRWREC